VKGSGTQRDAAIGNDAPDMARGTPPTGDVRSDAGAGAGEENDEPL
jgi:hypothetical protein